MATVPTVLLVSRWSALVPTGCIIPGANSKTWKCGAVGCIKMFELDFVLY